MTSTGISYYRGPSALTISLTNYGWQVNGFRSKSVRELQAFLPSKR